MKTASPELQAFLASTANMWIGDCYLFTLADGLVLAWTDFDQDLTVAGGSYSSSGPLIKRSKITQTIGLEVSTLQIALMAAPTHQITKVSRSGTVPVLAALAADRFAGANVALRRVYMPSPGDVSLGAVVKFTGTVADVEVRRTSADITVKSKTEKLDHMMPRHLIGPGCCHVLFDYGCGLNEVDWRTSGAVTGGDRFTLSTTINPPGGSTAPPSGAPVLTQSGENPDTNQAPQTVYVVTTYTTGNGETIASPEASIALTKNSLLRVASPGSSSGAIGWNIYVGTAPGDEQKQNQEPIPIGTNWAESADGIVSGAPPLLISTAGYYAMGVITFTSGVNKGLKRSITGNEGGTLSLKTGLPQAPASGDSFYVTPGDDKTRQTCQYKFNNLVHFLGFPFVPQPESVI